MYSIIQKLGLSLVIACAIACGDGGDDKNATINISGTDKEESGDNNNGIVGMSLDAGVGAEDAEPVNEADMLVDTADSGSDVDAENLDESDMVLVEPDAEVPVVEPDAEVPAITVSDLEIADWEEFCNRLTSLPDTLEVTNEDLLFGYCVARYNQEVEDYFAVGPADCGVSIFDCVDTIQNEHIVDLSICGDLTAVPENCDIEPLALESCVANLLEAQQVMGTQDVCAPTLENVPEFRATADRYQAAQICLDELASACPAL